MNPNIFRQFLAIVFGLFLTANLAPAQQDTNATAMVTNAPATVTREELAQTYQRLQDQIQAMRTAVEQSQTNLANAARTNADALVLQLQSLQKSIAAQRENEAVAARKTQQLTLFMAGAFGLAGLGVLLLMVYFQWRSFTQLAQISTQQHTFLSDVNAGVHQLAAPGRAQVESSNARLLGVVGQLEKRIQELEGGQGFLPGTTSHVATPVDMLTEAQKCLDTNQPQLALTYLDKLLAEDPGNPGMLIKKAIALEKLGRLDEALTFCDRAIAVDGTLALAHLHKGGVLNRLRRYDEALDCYESALQAQEKKSAPLAK